ncbi:TolB family protein [Salinicoccus bachuensis]|uniref:TolB family protein n=1 Tax=Salinicoccus bachuensis TaxID=3136731 RepID=A0ABZ3CHN7_9STAP
MALIGVVAVLFAASVAYSMMSDNDAYRHHTGLGEAIDISPDDEQLAFSYFDQGRESLHVGNLEDGSTEQITSPETENHSHPKFTPDGEGVFYIATVEDRIQTLRYLPEPDASPVQLTGSDMHVFEAVMSPDGETLYYIGMPAEDLLAREGEKENFRDLHRIDIDGEGHEKLTDRDAFDMSGLNISDDGETLYYASDSGMNSYDIESGTEGGYLVSELPSYIAHPMLSPDGSSLAYTTQAGESDRGTFIYELFLMDTGSGETDQLTDYDASVRSPVFFHEDDRIALLAQENWASEPASYEMMTVARSGGDMVQMNMSLPEAEGGFQLGAVLDRLVNTATLTILYLLMFGLAIIYGHMQGRTYLPAIASAVLTAFAIIGSIIASFNDPWMGIGVMMIAIWLLGCTIVLLAFAFIYKRVSSIN